MTKTATRKADAAEAFYVSVLQHLLDSGIPFMVGGAYALREYADIWRDTKDLDVFCTAGDATRLLEVMATAGYKTEITDANWLAKICGKDRFIDLIFNSGNGLCPVDESWIKHARKVELFGLEVKLVPAEEVLWQKIYIQDRHRYDGSDIHHIIRKQGAALDWHRLLLRMETHWELLLAHLINFRFVYPSEQDVVPRWLLDELLCRAQRQLDLPQPQDRICRGFMLSRTEYEVDTSRWDYRQR